MLIRFAVENFLSFKERQVFSMVAAKHTKHSDHIANIEGKRILKGSFIFGSNASGKSNFIKAVSSAKNVIFFGLSKMDRKYFRIDPQWKDKPGFFQFDLYANKSFYSYGFAFSYASNEIISEWLYKINTTKEICIFERAVKEGKNEIITDAPFSKKNQLRFKIYGEDLSKSKTFLGEIAEKEIINDEEFIPFKDVLRWFRELIIIFPDTRFSLKPYRNSELGLKSRDLFQALDTGIKSFLIKEVPIDSILLDIPESERENYFNSVIEFMRKMHMDSVDVSIGGDVYFFELKNNELFAFKQMMDHGNNFDLFSYSDESDGTKRLFDLLPLVSSTKRGVILIDELDRSFHTKLVIKYIELFYQNSKDQNIQLIGTLHDVNLMDLNIVRQDEIWFIYRDEESASSNMYSLNKFQIRFDKVIIKDYLLGRFGAIPIFNQEEEIND